ncbi:hypothetical protein, partial [Burkholderia pseudomallei]|uniref:hypothetical protein n=1 Tax=Burkholderia pseudomallei TaxID=28450 RepID=UPI001CA4CF94
MAQRKRRERQPSRDDARAGVVPAWLSLSPFALRHVALAVLVAAGVVPIWVNAKVVAGGAHAQSVIQTQNGIQTANINRLGAEVDAEEEYT